jgi:hypothetical protein
MEKTDFKSVEDSAAARPDSILGLVRSTIRKALPGADEVISHISTDKPYGRAVLYFAVKHHYSLYTLAVSHSSVEGRACVVQGHQGRDPVSALRVCPRVVDRAHREVSLEKSSRS